MSQQYLREDTREFLNAATSDEFLERGGGFGPSTFNADRTNIASGVALVGIVAGALLVRWLLDRLDLPQKAVGLGLFAAYVEVLWVWILAKRLSDFTGEVEAWVRTRRLSHWLVDRWGDLIDVLGPLGPTGGGGGPVVLGRDRPGRRHHRRADRVADRRGRGLRPQARAT